MKQLYSKVGVIGLSILLLLTGCGVKQDAQKKDITQETAAQEQPVTAAQEQEDATVQPHDLVHVYNYSFDLNNTKAVSVSSGTGGTQWHGDVAEDEYSKYFEDLQDSKRSDSPLKYNSYGFTLTTYLRAVGLENTQLMDEINSFIEDSEETLLFDEDVWANPDRIGETKLYEDAFCFGEMVTVNVASSYSSGSKGLAAVYNIRTGKRLALSDLFYDGFNYIDLINKDIQEQIDKSNVIEESPEGENEPIILKRPFSGITEDYPYFWTDSGYIYISFESGNPFFNEYQCFTTMLTKENSPYGRVEQKEADKDIKKTEVPVSKDFSVLRPELVGYTNAAAEKKINAAVSKLVDKIVADKKLADTAEIFITRNKLQKYNLSAVVGIYDGNISVSFSFIVPVFVEVSPPLIATMAFDMETGEETDLAKAIPEGFDWSKARFGPKVDAVNSDGISVFEDADKPNPPKPTTVLNTWLFGDAWLITDVITQDGRQMTAIIDVKDLG